MNDSGYVYIQLNSSDPTVQSNQTAVNFTNTLAQTLELDSNKKYECCMVACMFNNSQPLPDVSYFQPVGILTDNTTELYSNNPKSGSSIGTCYSVYVNCTLCQSSQIGSQLTQTLAFIPSTVIIENGCSGDNTHTNKPVFYVPGMARVWQPVNGRAFKEIGVSLTLSTGAFAPYTTGDYCSVIICIRPIDRY